MKSLIIGGGNENSSYSRNHINTCCLGDCIKITHSKHTGDAPPKKVPILRWNGQANSMALCHDAGWSSYVGLRIDRHRLPKVREKMKITINKARCKLCDSIIESKSVHDFVTCKCGNLSEDGGHSYLKRAGVDLDQYEELSDYVYDNPNDMEMM